MHRARLAATMLALAAVALLLMQGCAALSMLQGKPAKDKKAPAAAAGNAPACIVLALPTTGPFSPISDKIRQGTALAVQELAAVNAGPQLAFIDTEAADWPTQLARLPQHCQVVGSPLQTARYIQAKEAGLLQQRTFFALLPELEHGDEGELAWRFFPSAQDQIDALIGFANDILAIQTFGAFAPSDAFGMRTVGLFEQSLALRNMTLHKAFYSPTDVTTWSSAAASLINPYVAEGSKTPIPRTPFEAIFLPDSWKNLDMLVTSLLYNGEDRLVLLGTSLWEHGLYGKVIPNVDKYALAVFPVAWNPQTAVPALAGGDFWIALGYDFVRFAAAMHLTTRLNSSNVTTAAQRASGQIRGIAPISWDSDGNAHQRLHIFHITPTGPMPVDPVAFQQIREAVIQRTALRLQGLPPADSEGYPGTPNASEQPSPTTITSGQPVAGTPIMRPSPQPSYKLRLPGSR